MKRFYLTSIFLFLIISCSKDDPINEIAEEEEEIINLAPNDFNIEINNLSHESVTISWNQATDPENDLITYSVYLNQALVIENISELTYKFIDLEELTDYSGKIIAKDINNNETETTFSFQTEKYFLKYLKRYDYGQVNYGTVGYASGSPYSMLKTSNQDYVVIGKSIRLNGNGFQFFVLKIDYEGNEIWKIFYDYELGDDWNFKATESNDNGYILVGGPFVIKLDIDGNIIWDKRIDSYVNQSYTFLSTYGQLKSVKQDSQGNIFLVGGRGSSEAEIVQEGVLTKLNSSGDIIWEKTFKPSIRNFFNDLVINSSNELIVLGSTETSGVTYEEWASGNFSTSDEKIDFWVLKLNNDGEIIWENTFGDGKIDFPNQIISTSDNSFVVVGYGASLFKIDNAGDLVWSNSELSAYNPTFSISETNDNGFVTIGNFYVNTYTDVLLISKYDSNGNLEWEKSYNEYATWISGNCILSENDGGYRIAGNYAKANYNNEEKPSLLIFKTDPLGNHE